MRFTRLVYKIKLADVSEEMLKTPIAIEEMLERLGIKICKNGVDTKQGFYNIKEPSLDNIELDNNYGWELNYKIELGRIITNRSLTIEEALDIVEPDLEKLIEENGWHDYDYDELDLEVKINLPLFKNDVLIRDYIVVDPDQQNVVEEIYQEWAKREHIATRLQGDLVGSGVPTNEIDASKKEFKEWVKINYPTVKIIREEL